MPFIPAMNSVTQFLKSHPSSAIAEAVNKHLKVPIGDSTVRAWRKAKRIPIDYWPALVEAYPQLTPKKLAEMHMNPSQEA